MHTAVTPVYDPDLPADRRDDDRPGCGEARTPERALPLVAIDLDAALSGLTASCQLRQRFTNPTDRPVEVTYVFPLPNRGAVTAMTATLGGRRVEGRLLERAQARQTYEDAIAAGQRASLAEKDRPGVFTVTLGNLRPGEDADIELDLVCPLEVDDGEATFRFPLVVGPRYTSGVPIDVDPAGSGLAGDTDVVPDASRVTPPRLRPDDRRPELRARVRIDDGGVGLTGWRSSLHALTGEDGAFRLEPGERLDRDLILRARLTRDRLVTAAVVVPDRDGPEGTWMLSLIPPEAPAGRAGRDVVVLLDRSGSMSGWKLVAARRAAARLVDSLGADDRFATLAFDTTVESPTTALTAATDRNRFATVGWLAGVEARGGTELGAALERAADVFGDGSAGRARHLVLVTDGQVSGEDAVLTAVSRRLDGVAVHCVGIDQAVNAGLLDRLSRSGGGHLELVESEDRLDESLVRVCRVVNPPVLTDVGVTLAGAALIPDTVTPPVRDAVAGIPLVIAGRYRGEGPAVPLGLRLTASGPGSAALPGAVVAESGDAPAVPVLWARELIGDLEDRYASGEPDPGLSQRIIGLSLRFGVLSRFTAFVAVDAERGQTDDVITIAQPVEPPAGWAASTGGHRLFAAARSAGADGAWASPPAGIVPSSRRPRPGSGGPRPSDPGQPPGVAHRSAGGRGPVLPASSAPGTPAPPRPTRRRRDSGERAPLRTPSEEIRVLAGILAGVARLLARLAAGEVVGASAVRQARTKAAKLARGSSRASELERLAAALDGLSGAMAKATGPLLDDDAVRTALGAAQTVLAGLLPGAVPVAPAGGRRFWQRP